MKPSDFYLGASELFSILIPGFVATVIVSSYMGVLEYQSAGANRWALILVASYICGHILFAIGSIWDDLYEMVKPDGNDNLIDKVQQIRNDKSAQDCDSINNYKWSRSLLSKVHPDGYADVLRKEADSKLFRSLIIPLIITLVFLLLEHESFYATISLVMIIVTFLRYRRQRFKGCTIAYTNVIVLNQLGLIK